MSEKDIDLIAETLALYRSIVESGEKPRDRAYAALVVAQEAIGRIRERHSIDLLLLQNQRVILWGIFIHDDRAEPELADQIGITDKAIKQLKGEK